jgi:hypothetical protein
MRISTATSLRTSDRRGLSRARRGLGDGLGAGADDIAAAGELAAAFSKGALSFSPTMPTQYGVDIERLQFGEVLL